MNISTIISRLQELKDQYGDLPVVGLDCEQCVVPVEYVEPEHPSDRYSLQDKTRPRML